MKLIPNWKRILIGSWSMRLTYLAILIIAVPEAMYGLTGRQWVSPYLIGYAGLIVPLFTILGRVIDQGIGDR